MNLANKITMARLFMVPIFIVSMYYSAETSVVPLILFVVASATDALDGYVARHYNMITTFGKFVDPLVDKILIIAAFILMAERGHLYGWIVIIIITRELIITGFRTIAADKGVTIAASIYGKFKTISQMLCVIVYLLLPLIPSLNILYKILVVVMTALTVISGADYIYKNKEVLKG